MRGAPITTAWYFLLLLLFVGSRAEGTPTNIGDLDRLLVQHQPKFLDKRESLDQFERQMILSEGTEPVTFSIPGFAFFGCDKCHKGDDLVASAESRLRQVILALHKTYPAIKIPLRQYIVQAYMDKWLQGQQLAHTTFDTIRIFPNGILIDSKVYELATHQHETLHLTQTFLGSVNELEAYGLNVRADPRFMLLNYPYFSDVMSAFFVPEFEKTLKTWFARDTRSDLHVPREVQWYLMPFDKMDRLASAIARMSPLLDEVTRINKEQYLTAAYQSDRTGIPSLALDLAAVKLLPLPPITTAENQRDRAFEILAFQMEKNDNTRLGYVIDRKKEALMNLRYQLGLNDPAERLRLYFHYLKQRYILPDGQINLKPVDREDFLQYVQNRITGVQNLLKYEGITPVELAGGRQWEEHIKKELTTQQTDPPKP